jgi:crotonobetaine/carnitine-CoA ligase
VVPRPDAELKPGDLAHFINDNAPYYFVPRYIELASELPRNAQYKTDKVALRSRPLASDVWDRDRSGFTVTR